MKKIFFAFFLAACAARTDLGERDASVDTQAPDVTEERNCAITDCTFGHQCCAGSCSGPAVPMPSDCCQCLPGEVSSSDCGDQDRCGN